MKQLLPCPACNRHVDAAEVVCPFCASALPDSFRDARPPVQPPRRLGRAALMTAGAALMGAAACSSNDAIGTGPKDASNMSTGTGGDTLVAAYGGPITGTGGSLGAGGNTGAGGTVATGGTSGSTDAAPDAAGDAGRDAAQDRSLIPIYGAAVPAGLSESGTRNGGGQR